jgi:hypothetical protein
VYFSLIKNRVKDCILEGNSAHAAAHSRSISLS